ncbi:MAG: AAA family ATPase [Bacteroidetes bacterium]|nr:AAA family ATPase [Rhodothermaceae bacterium RA]RMH70361.1 MAG: AAA family ATPase [Bacteroidota bacterium]
METPAPPPTPNDEELLARLQEGKERILTQLRQRIVGQDDVIELTLMALFAGGHGLITGVPGLAKTLLIKSLGEILDLSYKRIQFTPDLMPADITGIDVIEEDRATGQRRLQFVRGPIFANIILADEINRTPPKTQAALLEAMQEHQVTAGGELLPLPEPFFVLATQNPIELAGTYPLPEAQLDRFMFNIVIDYLSAEDELQVALATTSTQQARLEVVLTGADILAFQDLVKKVYVPRHVGRFAVDLVRASRPGTPEAPDFVNEWVRWGAGLRATQYLLLGGKVRAVFRGRYNVAIEDVQALAHPVLRHRILTNFYADAEGIDVHQVIDRLLAHVREPVSGLA